MARTNGQIKDFVAGQIGGVVLLTCYSATMSGVTYYLADVVRDGRRETYMVHAATGEVRGPVGVDMDALVEHHEGNGCLCESLEDGDYDSA